MFVVAATMRNRSLDSTTLYILEEKLKSERTIQRATVYRHRAASTGVFRSDIRSSVVRELLSLLPYND